MKSASSPHLPRGNTTKTKKQKNIKQKQNQKEQMRKNIDLTSKKPPLWAMIVNEI
jgi:predicted permease